ncbi:2,3,4,5-tetrahydropyridine-2,6-dicarboxylate N-succinyltransferase, partial [Commensalibacter sp. Nvir]|uniref:2,3,4,5-tetrahydropyridine-2,6-dicarboxylate N-succinyltransferase n=1 Tax=Commensalibacter sp. Nvir TaxID=3069817 RepID=UPI0030C8B389
MNDYSNLQSKIEKLWQEKASLSPQTKGEGRESVEQVLSLLDTGALRVAVPSEKGWIIHEWIKKAVLLSFRLNENYNMKSETGMCSFDKVPLKLTGWDQSDYTKGGFRVVSGAVVRRSAYIAPNVVLMPSFVNVGAYVDSGTMIDTWVTVGSCAQVGKNCHISGGVGIGGVLEPLQASPVIIEDNCFIGARSEVAEGVVIEQGSVLSMGVFISASTKIIDRRTGEVFMGRVPAYSVVVPGTLPPSKSLSET